MNTRFSHLLGGGLLGLSLLSAAQADTIGRFGFVADTQIKFDEPATSFNEDEREGDGYDLALFDTKEKTAYLFEFNTVEFDDEENDGIRFNISQLSAAAGLNYAWREQSNIYWLVGLDGRMIEQDNTNTGSSTDTDIETGIGVRVGGGTTLTDGITVNAEARFSQIEDTSAYFFSLTGYYYVTTNFALYAEYEFGDYKVENLDDDFGFADNEFDIERSDFILGIAYNFSAEED